MAKRRGNCALPLPGTEKGSAQFPQRSKNRRTSISPNGFSGTARWDPKPEAARSAERANPRFSFQYCSSSAAHGQFFFLSDGSHSISVISAVASASRTARYAIHCHFSDSTSPSGLT